MSLGSSPVCSVFSMQTSNGAVYRQHQAKPAIPASRSLRPRITAHPQRTLRAAQVQSTQARNNARNYPIASQAGDHGHRWPSRIDEARVDKIHEALIDLTEVQQSKARQTDVK